MDQTNYHPFDVVENQSENDNNLECQDVSNLSKRMRKRLIRRMKWEENRSERKRKQKERRKLKKSIPNSFKKIIKMSESKCQANIIIDCDYQNYMNEDELKKLCNQLNRCYSLNRHSDAPVNLYFTSIKGKLQNFMKSLHPGYARWDVFLSEKHWSEIFSSKIIYLTGDSSNILPDCKEIQDSNDIFVIGGLIDHNRHKGLSLKRAIEEYKVQHSRLPLDLHIKLTQSRILSIPHVFEIMLNAVNKSMDDWSMIFKKVIPIRKQQLQIITDLEDSNKKEISMELIQKL